MASSLLNTDGKIKKLPKIHQQKKWYPVQPNSSLYLVAYGKQKRFVGKWKIKPFDVPIGSYTKGMKVDEAIQFLIDRIKRTKSNNEFLDTMSQ